MRREALGLLAQVEKQGLEIARAYQDGAETSGSFVDFRRFIEKVDHFYVFIDLVEDRLPRFEDDRRAALTRHLADIRWRIVIVEVDTTQIFLVRIGESGQPWPLGSRQFLQRRLDRLDEINAYYDAFGERYSLSPLSEAMVRAVGDLLKAEIPKASTLDDFTSDRLPELPRSENMSVQLDRGSARRTVPHAEPPRPLPPPFRVREMDGRFYVDRDSLIAVTAACRTAALGLDDLARQIGINRPALVLLLNGSDPIARGPMEEIRSFVSRHGGRCA